MAEKQEKRYVKGSNAKEFGKFGCVKIGLPVKELTDNANDKGYVNIVIGRRQQVSDKGYTHSVWFDDFVPTPRGEQQPQPQSSGDGW